MHRLNLRAREVYVLIVKPRIHYYSSRMSATEALRNVVQDDGLLLKLLDALRLGVLLIVLREVGNVFRVREVLLLGVCASLSQPFLCAQVIVES